MDNKQLEELLNSDEEDLGCVVWYHLFTDDKETISKALQGASEDQIRKVCDTVSRKMARLIIDNIQTHQNASIEEVAEARRELLIEIAGLQYGDRSLLGQIYI